MFDTLHLLLAIITSAPRLGALTSVVLKDSDTFAIHWKQLYKIIKANINIYLMLMCSAGVHFLFTKKYVNQMNEMNVYLR